MATDGKDDSGLKLEKGGQTSLQLQVLQGRLQVRVTVNNNSPIQDYVHPDDQTQPTFEMTPGFKRFTVFET